MDDKEFVVEGDVVADEDFTKSESAYEPPSDDGSGRMKRNHNGRTNDHEYYTNY